MTELAVVLNQYASQERYGDWYTGSEVDLDTTLLEYNSSTTEEPSTKNMRGTRRRKSAFPSLVRSTSQEGGNGADQVHFHKFPLNIASP